MPSHNFDDLLASYHFFQAHTTEAEQDILAHLPYLQEVFAREAPVRLLDFGCGDGLFTEMLLNRAGPLPAEAELTLWDPGPVAMSAAGARLTPYFKGGLHGLDSEKDLRTCLPFDLVLANQCFYYVDDLAETVHKLTGLLKEGGYLLAAMAPSDNVLIRLWSAGFAMADKSLPYFLAEDLRDVFVAQQLAFTESTIPYELRFPDTSENRMHILRILFARRLPKLAIEGLLPFFDPYIDKGDVTIQTEDRHFAVMPHKLE